MWQSQKSSKQSNTVSEQHASIPTTSQNFELDGDSGYLSNPTMNSSDLSGFDANMKRSAEVLQKYEQRYNTSDSGVDLVDGLSRVHLDRTLKQTKTMFDMQLFHTISMLSSNDMQHLQHLCKEMVRGNRDPEFDVKQYMLKDEEGDTSLHNAILFHYTTKLLKLILNVPDPALLNTTNKSGLTPLHLAVLHQQAGIVRLLVLSGANRSCKSKEGNTPLHMACKSGHLDSTKALLDPISLIEQAYHMKLNHRVISMPPDLEMKNYVGEACIHIATMTGSVPILRVLMSMGADLECKEGLAGKTALMLAIIHNKFEVVEFFLNECRPNLNSENYAGLTAYQVALSVGNYEIAKRLISLGATPEPLPEEYSSDEDMEEDISEVESEADQYDNGYEYEYPPHIVCNTMGLCQSP